MTIILTTAIEMPFAKGRFASRLVTKHTICGLDFNAEMNNNMPSNIGDFIGTRNIILKIKLISKQLTINSLRRHPIRSGIYPASGMSMSQPMYNIPTVWANSVFVTFAINRTYFIPKDHQRLQAECTVCM
jgi:hypothetical protein